MNLITNQKKLKKIQFQSLTLNNGILNRFAEMLNQQENAVFPNLTAQSVGKFILLKILIKFYEK